jgi:hypothetical protein
VKSGKNLSKFADELSSELKVDPSTNKIDILIFNFKEEVSKMIVHSSPEEKLTEIQKKVEPIDLEKKEESSFERATLLNEIREILSGVMPGEDLKKSYVLKKYFGSKDVAEIQISDEYTRNKVLFVLEAQGYFINESGFKVIATKKENLFKEIPNLNQKEKTLCQKFLQSIQEWMKEIDVVGEIRTHSIFLSNSNFTKELEIQCEDSKSAMLVEKMLITNNLNPRKIHKMIYVILNIRVLNTPFITPHIEEKDLEVFNRGLDTKSTNGQQSYTRLSTDYTDFHLLYFNRNIDQNHAEGIGKSIDEFGVVDFVKVVETDCIDGVMKKWIVDGQHTFTAMKKRGLPIVYVLIKVNTLHDVVRLIAVLNNRRKLWTNVDYLNAWLSLKVPIYITVDKWLKEKLQITLILEALSGKNRSIALKEFKDGIFQPSNEYNGEEILEHVKHIKPHVPKNAAILLGMQRFIRATDDFDRNQMLVKLKSIVVKNIFSVDDSAEEIQQKISKIYHAK